MPRTESLPQPTKKPMRSTPAGAETASADAEILSPFETNDVYIQGWGGDFHEVGAGTMRAVYNTDNELAEGNLDELPSTVRETLNDRTWALTGQAPSFKIENGELVKELPKPAKLNSDEDSVPPSILHLDGYTLFSFGAGKNVDRDALAFAVKGNVPSADYVKFVERHFSDVLDNREDRGLVMDVDTPPSIGFFYLDDYRKEHGLPLVEKNIPEQAAKDTDEKFTAPSPADENATDVLETRTEAPEEATAEEVTKGGLKGWLANRAKKRAENKQNKKARKGKRVSTEDNDFDALFSAAAEAEEDEADTSTKAAEPAETEDKPAWPTVDPEAKDEAAWPTADDAAKAEATSTETADNAAEDFAWPTEEQNKKAEKDAKGSLYERINTRIMMGLPKSLVETDFLGNRKMNKYGKSAVVGAVAVLGAWLGTKGFTEIPFTGGGGGGTHAADTANNIQTGGAGSTVTETAPSGTGAPAPTEATHSVANDPQEMHMGSHAGAPAPEVSHPANTGGQHDLPKSTHTDANTSLPDAHQEQTDLAPLPEAQTHLPKGGNVWDTSHDVLKYYGYSASNAQVDALKDFLLEATRTTEETARHMETGQKLPIPNPEQLRQLIGDIK